MFALFGIFILACGTTHLLDILMFYSPQYRLSGLVKLITAAASWGTVLALMCIVPQASTMKTADALEHEVNEPRLAEEEVRSLNAQLEARVSERTRELQISIDRFAAIVSTSAHIIWTRDVNSQFSSPQPSWSAFTGQSFDELKGDGWHDAIHPEDRERVIAAWRAAVASEENYHNGYRLRRHDGQYRNMEIRGVPVRDQSGAIREWVGTNLDVTERVQDAEELAARARLATLSAEVGLLLTRDDALPQVLQSCAQSMVTHLDAAFARIWMLDEDEDVLKMQASAGMYTHLDGPHGRVPVGKFKIGKIAAERKPHLTNQVVGDPQVGDQQWATREGMVAFAGYPMIVGDRLIGVIAVFARRPLTDHALEALGAVADAVGLGIQRRQSEVELAQSEARKSAILETALDCIIGIDHHHQVVEWNPAAEKTFGYSREEALGQSLPELIIPPSLRDAHRGGMNKYLETGIGPVLDKRIEVPAIRRGGEEFPVELAVTRIQGEETPFFTAYLRDITARKQAEHDLEKARDDAETANKTKSLFLANMSHELRTPLNAILGYSEMLHEEASEPGMENFAADLERINSSGKHLLTLINDILDLSKIEAGKMEVFIEEFHVCDVVQELAETIRPLMEKSKNSLQIECDPNLGDMSSDLTKVRQSLLNLLSNAAKFTSDGEVTLEAKRERMDKLDWIVLRVRDNGIGMSAEQVVKLFRPFTQADASTTRKFGGTGLGLALTRRFCQMLHGDVTVASVLGEGSTFTIKIPAYLQSENAASNEASLRPESEVESEVENEDPPLLSDLPEADDRAEFPILEDAEEELSEGAIAPASPPQSYSVLVIDDDATQRALMRKFLERKGFAVVVAGSGEEGLEMARRLKPLAITLDVMMADMDGWSVLSELKNDPELQEIPVVMLTMVDDQNKGYALGAADYLTKPVDRARLTQILQKHCCPDPPCTVLVVEDDETVRVMLCKMLTTAGWSVSQAINGREALESIEAKAPELILMDLMMPEMDGFEFIAELRRHPQWQKIPTVVLTAKELTQEDRLRLNGYVQKVMQKIAYSREELLEQISQLIASYTRGEN